MIRVLCQAATFRRNYPDVCIAILVKLFAGAVRNKGDARAIRRPLRVRIIPVNAFCDLFRISRCDFNDPKVSASVVEPTTIVEFVRRILVVTHVAAIFTFGTAVAWSYAADGNQPRAVRRPARSEEHTSELQS